MTQIKTASGRTRRVAPHVDIDTIVGLDFEGRVVVREPGMNGYAFGLTLCCDAFDKGGEDGAYCRACHGSKPDADEGYYYFDEQGGAGIDPVAELKVPH